MFHSNTKLLIDYWRERRGERALPLRSAIDPMDFAALLPQTFVAAREAGGAYIFRLAGETLADLHGRGLRGEALTSLWRPAHRVQLVAALDAALRAPSPLVVHAEGRTDDATALRLEILFAPLADSVGTADRFLGHYQPAGPLSHLHGRAFRELAILDVSGTDERQAAPRLRLAAVDGRQIA
ncbi:MAG: PAS domain-containing protein [Caulobacterales bacterium]|jgi:hypothetical protein